MNRNEEKSNIIILQGGPATGKTTLGKKVAKEFQFPYFSKDNIKELIFDYIGLPTTPALFSDNTSQNTSDDENEGKLSGMKMDEASVAILFQLIEAHIQVKKSCIIDCTFDEIHSSTFKKLKSKYFFFPIQIYCYADLDVLSQRYKERAETRERHPGHFDNLLLQSFLEDPSRYDLRPLDIEGAMFSINTTNHSSKDYDQLIDSISKSISQANN
tara:strand:- start:247 stop:888 length:642 start_codon:yes stop_codon:yes gene_type:complete